MPTKTITLEIDAYEKLRAAKRGGESFTEVVRRAVIPASAPTGQKPAGTLPQRRRRHVSDEYLDSAEQAAAHDAIPDDPWA